MRGRPIYLLVLATILFMLCSLSLTMAGEDAADDTYGEEREITELRERLRDISLAASRAEKKGEREAGAASQDADYLPGELILRFENEMPLIEELPREISARLEEYLPQLDMARISFPEALPVAEVLDKVRDLKGVAWAEPNYIRAFDKVPDDTRVAQQWYLDDIQAYSAWDVTTGGSGVTIAVIDTGINAAHEDLSSGRVLAGSNVMTGGSDVTDGVGHGTMVAGVAAADTDNATGIAGIDWKARILPVKAGDQAGVSAWDSAAGIQYAADQGVDVINMSYGGTHYSQAEREAVDYAVEKGCVLVGASGNDGDDQVLFPAAYPNVMGVGSTGKTGARSDFSNYGMFLDVTAPGEELIVPGLGNSYYSASGTSFSAPLVSGQAALILAAHPASTPGRVEWRIEEGAQGATGWDERKGFGVIDIRDSLNLAGEGYADSLEPNNTEGQARGAATGIYTSYISCNSDIDVYRISPDMSGYGWFGLMDIPGGCDYDLWLYKGEINGDPEEGTLWAGSFNSGNSPELCKAPMKAGEDYYLVVDSAHGYSDSAYSLLVLEPYLSSQWYFAEGTTRSGFEEWLCLLNPGDASVTLQCEYMFPDGRQSESYQLPPHSRYTVNVNEEVSGERDISIALDSDNPVMAERPMYFDYKGTLRGGHDVVGSTMPSGIWYFAEGYTGTGFDTWLCLQNPNDYGIDATITFMFEGGGTQTYNASLDPLSRFTLNVNETVGPDRGVSMMVESLDPLIAERPVYFNYKGVDKGGHNVVGANLPSTTWFFAEGCTRGGFEEWLCLQNPYPTGTGVDILYSTQDGPAFYEEVYIPGNSRKTVNVNESLGPDQDVSVIILSEGPIVAERPMYFNYQGARSGGHDSVGCDIPSYGWYFGEGYTGTGFDTWLCLQNPMDETASVQVIYMLGSGQVVHSNHNIAAYSRYTVKVSDIVGYDQNVAIQVESSLPIVAERPMYFSYKGAWSGGHDAMGYVPGN